MVFRCSTFIEPLVGGFAITITPSVLMVWKQIVEAHSFRTTLYIIPGLNIRSSILMSKTVDTYTNSRNGVHAPVEVYDIYSIHVKGD